MAMQTVFNTYIKYIQYIYILKYMFKLCRCTYTIFKSQYFFKMEIICCNNIVNIAVSIEFKECYWSNSSLFCLFCLFFCFGQSHLKYEERKREFVTVVTKVKILNRCQIIHCIFIFVVSTQTIVMIINITVLSVRFIVT